MSLANGQPYLAIPGPSATPARVLAAMHRASPNIYGDELSDLMAGIVPDLRRLAGTSQHVATYIGNGHAAWEAACANLFNKGETALVLASGHFGLGWANQARAMGINVQLLDFGRATPADPSQLEAALRADHAGQIKAVLVTHVDTATGVRADIPALRQAMTAAGHDALLAVDCVASMGCDRFEMDAWGVDVTLSASQKGMMMPPGLAFLWFSEAARQRLGQGDLASPWWRWGPRAAPAGFWQYWNGTAPTQALFGLREALSMILDEEGLAAVWHRHDALAQTVWAAFDAWGVGHPQIGLNVARPEWRARAVTAARIGGRDASRLRQWCEQKAGVTLGIGLGMDSPEDPGADGALRLAHMGHVNAHMTLGALAVMQAGLTALGISHGPGALDAATRVVAELA